MIYTPEERTFKLQMFAREIESKRQALQAFIKSKGYVENLGQIEQRDFDEKVERCEELTYGEKANLQKQFAYMLNEL